MWTSVAYTTTVLLTASEGGFPHYNASLVSQITVGRGWSKGKESMNFMERDDSERVINSVRMGDKIYT